MAEAEQPALLAQVHPYGILNEGVIPLIQAGWACFSCFAACIRFAAFCAVRLGSAPVVSSATRPSPSARPSARSPLSEREQNATSLSAVEAPPSDHSRQPLQRALVTVALEAADG